MHRIGRTGRAGRAGRAFSFVRGKEVYRLRDIQKYCKTKIISQHIPTIADVNAIKTEKIMDDIARIIENDNLHDMIDVIDNQVNTSDYTAMDIAAAFLKLALDATGDNGETAREQTDDEVMPWDDDKRSGKKKHKEYKERKNRKDRKLHLVNEEVEEGMVRFKISLGKKHGIRPNDIVRIISSEAHIPGKVIGAIGLKDSVSYVELPTDLSSTVLKSLKKAKFKDKKLGLELAYKKK